MVPVLSGSPSLSFWWLDAAYRDGGSVRNDVAGPEPGDSERILAVARGG
jgi:hypothetical protein